ncbi:MAG: glycosyltransferase family 4 protein [Candidatus Edwardsbacteria bacterium]|nr:glycosyltransferase family 4 protein [Candidatus Edwardsbacteria bacterium]
MASVGKRHVLFIVENLSVPFDRRVWREARALSRNGYKVSVICPKGLRSDIKSFEVIEGIDIHRYNIPLTQNSKTGYVNEYLRAFSSTLFLLIKINLKHKVDAIHVANPPEIFFPLGWLGKVLGFKFVFDHHDLSPETYTYKFGRGKNGLMYKLLLMLERMTFFVSYHVISTNQSLREIAQKRGKISDERITIVRNGPDNAFIPVSPKHELKKGKKYLAAYLGVMGQTDGVENIIYAADKIINEHQKKDILFILIGYGDEYHKHCALVKNLNLTDCVDLPGRLPDKEVLDILSTSDLCLAPDPANGLNEFHTMNKIMDYMRCGKAIVSFDLAESKISADRAAIYVNNNDTSKFAREIIQLLEDPQKRLEMGAFGKKRVEEQLKWEYSEKIFIDTYKNKIFANDNK